MKAKVVLGGALDILSHGAMPYFIDTLTEEIPYPPATLQNGINLQLRKCEFGCKERYDKKRAELDEKLEKMVAAHDEKMRKKSEAA